MLAYKSVKNNRNLNQNINSCEKTPPIKRISCYAIAFYNKIEQYWTSNIKG